MTHRRSIELVWDDDQSGTACATSGRSLRVGSANDWMPEELLSLSAEADFMNMFMQGASEAGLHVHGYVSAAEMAPGTSAGTPLQLVLRPCIVVGSEAEVERARAILEGCAARSPVCLALASLIDVRAEVIALADVPQPER